MQAQGILAYDFFRGAFDRFEQTVGWLQSESTGENHSEMERALCKRGFELMRVLYQSWLDRRSAQERQRVQIGATVPGVEVRSRGRDIEYDFGRVRLNRMGHKRVGQTTEFPLDRELNLPDELYPLEVCQRVAFEAQRSSWDETVDTIARTSGAHIAKRQAQELASRLASPSTRCATTCSGNALTLA